MSIFDGMDAKQIAMCLSAFYEASRKNANTVVYYLPNRGKPITVDQEGFNEGIKILRDDYDVFWTPDTNPDDLPEKTVRDVFDEFTEEQKKVVHFMIWAALKSTGTPADICNCIQGIKLANSEQTKTAIELTQIANGIAKERDNIDRLRRHWHSKYEKEHEECVRLSKLHVADKKKVNEQDETIRKLNNDNTTLSYSVAALKKKIRNLEDQLTDMFNSDL